ncbi:testis-specific serine/threonine-protein kinase 1-like [Lycorma delicatula]|uniref:testis-specific serine/threonine-protein kinase 1-like n=1 Tax=Lycorma delicatula TaxID=130591 RepID=UPI003F50FA8D
MIIACKIVDSDTAPKDFIKRFFPREIEVICRIKNPYLISTYCVLQRKSRYYIFMRYCEGGDLLDYIYSKDISESRAKLWMNQLGIALLYLHRMNIAHRDIKCENILITNNLNVKLADFGFARFVVDNGGNFLMSRTFCGSLPYTAPEILEGHAYDARKADMWSLGVVLYVMLNRSLPFESQSVKILIQMQLANQPVRHRPKAMSTTTELFRRTVDQLIVVDPRRRWNVSNLLTSQWINLGNGRHTNDRLQRLNVPYDSRDRQNLGKLISQAANNAANKNPNLFIIKHDITKSAESLRLV